MTYIQRETILSTVPGSFEVFHGNGSHPDLYLFPLSHPAILDRVISSMVEGGMTWAWRSSRGLNARAWLDDGSPPQRTFCLLGRDNQSDILHDIRELSLDEVQRCFTILGGVDKQSVDRLDTDVLEESISSFLTGKGGLDILLYQPGDKLLEYVFVSKTLSESARKLLEEEWGLFTKAKRGRGFLGGVIRVPPWLKRVWRTGILPP